MNSLHDAEQASGPSARRRYGDPFAEAPGTGRNTMWFLTFDLSIMP
jgi:hypothetical protein